MYIFHFCKIANYKSYFNQKKKTFIQPKYVIESNV